jgi:hypothetical protein
MLTQEQILGPLRGFAKSAAQSLTQSEMTICTAMNNFITCSDMPKEMLRPRVLSESGAEPQRLNYGREK